MVLNTLGAICVKLYKPFSRKTLNRFIEEELQKIPMEEKRTFKVLNIGAGGDIYQKLRTHPSLKIDQLDVDPNRHPDILGDVTDMIEIKSDTYDYVFLMEVLEHVRTPQEAVNEIYRVLKKEGKVIFSTPFIFPIHDEPHDYYRYTHYGLRYLLRAFEIEEIRERNDYIQAVVLMLIRTIVIGNKKQRLASAFIYITTVLTYPLWLSLSWLLDCKLATTGYCGVAQKTVQ